MTFPDVEYSFVFEWPHWMTLSNYAYDAAICSFFVILRSMSLSVKLFYAFVRFHWFGFEMRWWIGHGTVIIDIRIPVLDSRFLRSFE